MDKQENIIIGFPSKKKLDFNSKKWDIYSIAALIILTILFPFGVLSYIWGRMNFLIPSLVLATMALLIFMLFCFVTGMIRFLRKNTWKKKILIFIEILIPFFFIVSYFIPFNMPLNLYDSGDPFLCGFRDRIRSKLDIKETQDWLRNYSLKNNVSLYDNNNIQQSLPECLKPISSWRDLYFHLDSKGNPTIEQHFGVTFWDWGLVIGMEDMPFPDSNDFAGIWMPVAQGIYVYAR